MTIYPSKLGLELLIPIAVLLAGVGGFSLYKGIWPGAGIVLLISCIVGHLLVTTYYKIDESTVQIRSGLFFNKSLSIKSIRKIVETRNPISSPALSLDRIELIYNRFDSVLISPKDKAGFIKELTKLNPAIEVRLKSRLTAG